MPHLTLEALARLVDEAPDAEEQQHLDGCESCREELEALREQTESLASMPDLTPPPDLWPELRTRLRKEGLVTATGRRLTPTLTRIAAALTLFVAGGAAGWTMRGTAPGGALAPDAAGPDAVAAAPAARQSPATPTGAGAPDMLALGAGDDLSAEVERTQEAFAAALDRYMMVNGTSAPDPAARLAALDNIVLTTAEALNESPADPVINGYHLTAVAQRNELLRQIAASGEAVF